MTLTTTLTIFKNDNDNEINNDNDNDITDNDNKNILPALGEDLHEVVGQVTSGQVETQDGVGQGVTLVDGDGVRDAVAGVEDDTGGATGSVERQHGLDGDVPKKRENGFR